MKTIVEWFQAVTKMLRPLRCAHPGANLGGGHCAMPFRSVWAAAQSKKVQNIRENRVIRLQLSMHVEMAYATWHFSIILISLRVEEVQISDFLVHAKILPL